MKLPFNFFFARDVQEDPVFRDPPINGVSRITESEREDSQANPELDESIAHPISIDELEDGIRSGLNIQDEQDDRDLLPPSDQEIVQDMTWLHFPRAGDTFGARFEIPIDLRKLKSNVY